MTASDSMTAANFSINSLILQISMAPLLCALTLGETLKERCLHMLSHALVIPCHFGKGVDIPQAPTVFLHASVRRPTRGVRCSVGTPVIWIELFPQCCGKTCEACGMCGKCSLPVWDVCDVCGKTELLCGILHIRCISRPYHRASSTVCILC